MATTEPIKLRIPEGILSLVDSYGIAIGSNRSETLRLLVHMALATDHVVGVIKRNSTLPETADLIRANDDVLALPKSRASASRGGA